MSILMSQTTLSSGEDSLSQKLNSIWCTSLIFSLIALMALKILLFLMQHIQTPEKITNRILILVLIV